MSSPNPIEGGLVYYQFNEYLDKAPSSFSLSRCVYSDESLDRIEFTALTQEVRKTIQSELGALAVEDPWPAHAV